MTTNVLEKKYLWLSACKVSKTYVLIQLLFALYRHIGARLVNHSSTPIVLKPVAITTNKICNKINIDSPRTSLISYANSLIGARPREVRGRVDARGGLTAQPGYLVGYHPHRTYSYYEPAFKEWNESVSVSY